MLDTDMLKPKNLDPSYKCFHETFFVLFLQISLLLLYSLKLRRFRMITLPKKLIFI